MEKQSNGKVHGNGIIHGNGKLAGNASLAQYTLYGYGCRKLSES